LGDILHTSERRALPRVRRQGRRPARGVKVGGVAHTLLVANTLPAPAGEEAEHASALTTYARLASRVPLRNMPSPRESEGSQGLGGWALLSLIYLSGQTSGRSTT
jgi:hypothetical protein